MLFFRFCFVQVDKELYAVGGCDSRPQNVEVIDDVECYNQEHDQWESVEPLPKPLRYEIVLLVNLKFLLKFCGKCLTLFKTPILMIIITCRNSFLTWLDAS